MKDKEDFQEWIDTQLRDDPKGKELYEFHSYIREDGLDAGTRLGYQKKVRDELDDDGYFEQYDEALSEDADSALKKYREFLDTPRSSTYTEGKDL